MRSWSISRAAVFFLGCALGLGAQASPPANAQAAHPCLGDLTSVSQDEHAVAKGLARLYLADRFNELDQSMACLLASKPRLQSGHTAASGVYEFYRSQMPAPGLNPDQAGRVARWTRAQPGSIYAEFATLRLAYAGSWERRGGEAARQTPRNDMSSFVAGMQGTARALQAASPAMRQTVLWHQLRLATLLDTPNSRGAATDAFAEGVRQWPDFFEFYSAYLSRLTPRWGGSWAEVDRFARQWSGARAATDGKSFYARLYLQLFWSGFEPDQARVDWPTLRESLLDLGDRFPTVWNTNLGASLACLKNDREVFSRLVGAMPGYAPGIWFDGTDLDRCGARFPR